MKRCLSVMLSAFLTASAVGCTTRYSQTLTGTIPQTSGRNVESSDSGFSFLGITLDEPRSAHEQVTSLLIECSALNKVEVDYRELLVLIFGIPKVSIQADCVQ